MKWKFSTRETDEALRFYREQGFVAFDDLLGEEDVKKLHAAYEETLRNGNYGEKPGEMVDGSDAVFRHPLYETYMRDPRIVSIVEKIFGADKGIELQHSKLNCKPAADTGKGVVEWHQDYPFFPHTNFDLIAVGIHFDDEDETSGPLCIIPGSFKQGVLSHCEEGKFVYRCTAKFDETKGVLLTGKRGMITIHDCRTLHASARKTSESRRRLLVLQYRTDDNVQISGVLWRSTGLAITANKSNGTARFPDGLVVENRGKGGRLYDKYGKLAPDQQPKPESTSAPKYGD